MRNCISQCEINENKIPRESPVNEVVKLERRDVIAIVTVNSPPVNALSAAVRGGILECMKSAIADPEVKAIVLTCAGRTFIAGADITEFGKPPKPPGLHEVLTVMENSLKPIVAAVHGKCWRRSAGCANCAMTIASLPRRKPTARSSPTQWRR